MKRLLIFALLLLAAPAFGQALSGINGDCQIGGQEPLTSGLPATATQQIGTTNVNQGAGVQASFPKCLVSVYATGTTNKANIYSTNTLTPTPLTNPFVANVDGSFTLYAPAGCFDVIMSSGAGPALPYTRSLSGVCVGQGTVTIPGGSGTVSACATPGAMSFYQATGTTATCDPNFVTDGSGNAVATSMTFNGPGAGFVGFSQGTVPPFTVANTAYLYADTSVPNTFGTILPAAPGTLNQVLGITQVVDSTHIRTGWVTPAGGGSGTSFAGTLDVTGSVGADICAQVVTAQSSLPASGGRLWIPPGIYPACASTITLTKNSVTLQGSGNGNPFISPAGATVINMPAGVAGIDITGERDVVEDLTLLSASTGAGSDYGIRNRAGAVKIDRVTARHFGGPGIETSNAGVTQADLWHYEDVEATYNFGSGFQWDAPCTDNHLGTAIQLDSVSNGGWGYDMQCGVDNNLQTLHMSQNTLGGVHVGSAGSYNYWYDIYAEGGTGSSFVIDSGAGYNRVWFQAFGQPATITTSGGTASSNEIHYFGPDNWLVQNGFRIGDQPGATGNSTYSFNVGAYAPGFLGLYDNTRNAWLYHYSPGTKWTFDQKATFTPATLAGVNLGALAGDPGTLANGDMWYNSLTNKFRCFQNSLATDCIVTGIGSLLVDTQVGTSYIIPSSDAGKLVAVNNTNPISWTGPALANNISFQVYDIGTGLITYTPASGTVNGNATQIIPQGWYGFHYTDNVNSNLFLMPTITAFPSCLDAAGNHLNFDPSTGAISCGNSGGAGFPAGSGVPIVVSGTSWGTTKALAGSATFIPTSTALSGAAGTSLCDDGSGGIADTGCTLPTGTVTHTGNLTAGQVVIGNGTADEKIDTGCSTDGVGNMTCASFSTSGPPGLFSSLPSCSGNEGRISPVTDSTTATWGATITGGGGNHVLAYCDGSAWTVAAK